MSQISHIQKDLNKSKDELQDIAKEKIETTKIKEAGEYTLRVILSYFDENGNRKNIKKDAILKITDEI